MSSNSKSELAMGNSIVELEVREERMEAETVEASLPAQEVGGEGRTDGWRGACESTRLPLIPSYSTMGFQSFPSSPLLFELLSEEEN
jgi:hypothetical protein